MGRNPSRELDKTFLSLDLAEERILIHRDYLAHCFRWSHVTKFLARSQKFKSAVVLDVGCGKEMPLAKLLYVNKMTPLKYVGVDANKFDIPEMLRGKKIDVSIWAETDLCALTVKDVWCEMGNKDGQRTGIAPNILTCYEVLEHITPRHCRLMLQHFLALSSPDCHYFISTPCYNGSAAGNHINEMGYQTLGALIEDLGFEIQGVWGTFASISDYKDGLNDVEIVEGTGTSHTDLMPVFNALRNYYDTNVLAVMFAPLFPERSRNCLWHLTRKTGDAAKQERLFSSLEQVPGPWSQHPNWRDLAG